MARIVILGCAGSGKTTLARQLAERTGAPLISLDGNLAAALERDDVPAFRSMLEKAHSGTPGSAKAILRLRPSDIRLPRATLIVWLERTKLFCSWHAIARVFKPVESHRLGNLAKVLAFIWNFDRMNRPRIEASRMTYDDNVPVERLNGDRDIADFLSSYGDSAKQ